MLAAEAGRINPPVGGAEPGLDEAEAFISALTGSPETPVTLQTFCDGGESSASPAVMHSTVRASWARLCRLQDAGHGVFVMINEGDGKGRAGANVIGIRSLFADADAAPVDAARLGRPSMIVSSGRGEHYYWLLKPGQPLEQFSPAQKAIAARLGTDAKVFDLPRVLRLPGTMHLKDRANPRPVELVWCDPSSVYEISEILKTLGATPSALAGVGGLTSAGSLTLASSARNRAEAYVRTIFAVQGAGGDQATYRVAAALLRDFDLNRETAWSVLQNWNATNASPPWDDKELGRKLMHAGRYGKAPVGGKLAEDMGAAIAANARDTVAATAYANAQLDPANWCYDLSRGGRAWRYWSGSAWDDGVSDPALDRLLKNAGHLRGPQVDAWKAQATVVAESAPVYESRERLVNVRGRVIANTFRPPGIIPQPGDWSPIAAILDNLVGGDASSRGWLEGWLARLTQAVHAGRPARIGTAPVFTGSKGAGKGVLEEICKAILGRHNVASITQRELSSDFNSYLDGVLLVFANEVWSSDNRSAALVAKLKDLITCHERIINKKGIPEATRTAVENWILASNSHRPVEIEKGDRRFSVFRTGGPIDVDLGARVADDARADGPIVRAFLDHLLSIPASALASDYRPFETDAKAEVAAASGNSATKFAYDVRTRGMWSVTAAWAGAVRLTPNDLYLSEFGGLRSVAEESPVLLRRRLLDVYRAWASEIGAPAQQETTLMAAMREELPGLTEATLIVDGRKEYVVAGFPGAFPESHESTEQLTTPF